MSACILLPPTDDLALLTSQREALAERERAVAVHLSSYTSFLTEVQEPDAQLIQRLVECELNQVPAGQQAVLMSSGGPIGTLNWLQEAGTSFRPHAIPAHEIGQNNRDVLAAYEGMATLSEPTSGEDKPRSILQRIAASRHRLWVLGASGLCIFLGLMTSMPTISVSRKIRTSRLRHQATKPPKKKTQERPSLMTCGRVVSTVHGPLSATLSKAESPPFDDQSIDEEVGAALMCSAPVETSTASEEHADQISDEEVESVRAPEEDSEVVSLSPNDIDVSDRVVEIEYEDEVEGDDDGEWEYEYVEEFVEMEEDGSEESAVLDASEEDEDAWDEDEEDGELEDEELEDEEDGELEDEESEDDEEVWDDEQEEWGEDEGDDQGEDEEEWDEEDDEGDVDSDEIDKNEDL